MSDQFVYFIQADENGPIKIGFTASDPKQRLNQLQTSNPAPLKLLGAIRGDTSRERQFHAELAAWRMQGEWFQAHPTVLATIEEALTVECKRGERACRLHCSFCMRCEHEVTLLIAGPCGHICDLCTDDCFEIVSERRLAAMQTKSQDSGSEPEVQPTSSFPISEGVR